MSAQAYTLSTFPLFAVNDRGRDPEGYQFITPLIHAVATRAVYSQNAAVLAALTTALGATNYTNTPAQQGLGAYCTWRFPAVDGKLVVFAGLNNSTDNANMVRLGDYSNTPAYPAKLESFDLGNISAFMTSVWNQWNNTYKTALYNAIGYNTTTHALGNTLSICGHGIGAAYALLAVKMMLVDNANAGWLTPVPISPVSLFGSPNCANRQFADAVNKNTYTTHYFHLEDPNITRPIMNSLIARSGEGPGMSNGGDWGPPWFVRMMDVSVDAPPFRPAGQRSIQMGFIEEVSSTTVAPNPVNTWDYRSTIETYKDDMFRLAVQPDCSTVVQQLQVIDQMIDAIPYTMGSTNPAPASPALPTNNIAGQVTTPTNSAGAPISGLTPAPSIVGGQITLRAVDSSTKTGNAYRGYDRRLLETVQQALGNQIKRDDLLEFTNSVVPSNGSPIWDSQDTNLMESLDIVMAHIQELLSETNVSPD